MPSPQNAASAGRDLARFAATTPSRRCAESGARTVSSSKLRLARAFIRVPKGKWRAVCLWAARAVHRPLLALATVSSCGHLDAPTRIQLVPHLGAHDVLHFDVSIDWTNTLRIGDRADHQHATIDLIADADVTTLGDGTIKVVQRFETPSIQGDDALAQALEHAAIAHASVTTRIAHDGDVISSRIDGTTDDDARSIAASLGQLVSFRFVRPEPVNVGDEWDKRWTDTATGVVETGAHYRLDRVVSCGVSKCGVIVVRGLDADARSTFDGELVVELDSLRPVRKRVDSTTTSSGEQEGTPYTLEARAVLTATRR